jgi:hypothetical protein
MLLCLLYAHANLLALHGQPLGSCWIADNTAAPAREAALRCLRAAFPSARPTRTHLVRPQRHDADLLLDLIVMWCDT